MLEELKDGEKLIVERKLETAELFFQKLLVRYPKNADILNNMGIIRDMMGDPKSAVDLYKKAILADPKHMNARINLAAIYQKTQQWQKAVHELERCLQIDNTDNELLGQIASIYLSLGMHQKAEHIAHKLAVQNSVPTHLGKKKAFSQSEHAEPINPKVAEFRAAFAEVNITPSVSEEHPVLLQGLAGPSRKATRVSHPLMMQLLLIEDAQFNKVLMVAADLFGFDSEIVKLIGRAAAPWGIPPEAIILNASHTHYAPGTLLQLSSLMGPFYGDYAGQVAQEIVRRLPDLYQRLEECHIYQGKTETCIGVNRRRKEKDRVVFGPNPSGAYDKITPIVSVEFAKSKRRALLISHGCHPTGLGRATRISSDFPGYLRDTLYEAGVADIVLFLQGPGGSAKESAIDNGEVRFCSHKKDVIRNGRLLADQICVSLGRALRPVSGTIFSRCHQIALPLQSTPDLGSLEKVVADQNVDPLIRSWANHLSAKYNDGFWPKKMNLALQWISIGDQLVFITFPSEPTAELAQQIRALPSIPPNAFILGYTNGLNGYLPSDQMIAEGGYETELSHVVYQTPAALKSGSEQAVLDAVHQSVQTHQAREVPNGYGRYHLTPHQKNAFFVLSAGRCGTMTLAHILDTAENARVWHHPQPDLINASLQAYWCEIDKSRTFWRARQSLLYQTWADGLIHGETDLLMTPFADTLADEIPDAKFLVLVRDPRDFVRSGMRRKYYQGHPWDVGRWRPKHATDEHAEWLKLDQFEKICWLWQETYHYIMTITSSIAPERVMLVRFEDLTEDINITKDIFKFTGLRGFEEIRIEQIKQKKLNSQQTGHFPRWPEWTDDRLTQINKICGDLAKEFKYNPLGSTKKPIERQPDLITIWDYKKYTHQQYPHQINPQFFKKGPNPKLHITYHTKITSMGSCFARNIALFLRSKKYNYLVTEQPFQEASAHWDQVFNTACMRQLFEYTFTSNWNPIVRWWPRGNFVQDPFRRNVLYPKNSCEEAFERHRAASQKALGEAEVVILTLGLIETWRDIRDRMTFYRVPPVEQLNMKYHEFYLQSVEDCHHDLNVIHELLKSNNPAAQIIITVSPVPLFATFREDVDPVTANMMSKATLRVAAEYFARQHYNVHYFPALEIVTQAFSNPYEADNRHIKKEVIDAIMGIFESRFAVYSRETQKSADFNLNKIGSPSNHIPCDDRLQNASPVGDPSQFSDSAEGR